MERAIYTSIIQSPALSTRGEREREGERERSNLVLGRANIQLGSVDMSSCLLL